jgi:hypothetical protein
MRLQEMYNHLCNPAKLYLILSILAIIIMMTKKMKMMAVVFKILFSLFFVYVLNFICKKGFKTLAWILVILPYFFLFLAMTNLLVK